MVALSQDLPCWSQSCPTSIPTLLRSQFVIPPSTPTLFWFLSDLYTYPTLVALLSHFYTYHTEVSIPTLFYACSAFSHSSVSLLLHLPRFCRYLQSCATSGTCLSRIHTVFATSRSDILIWNIYRRGFEGWYWHGKFHTVINRSSGSQFIDSTVHKLQCLARWYTMPCKRWLHPINSDFFSYEF